MFVIKIKGWGSKNRKNSCIANSYLNSHMPRIRSKPKLVIEVLSIASMCSSGKYSYSLGYSSGLENID